MRRRMLIQPSHVDGGRAPYAADGQASDFPTVKQSLAPVLNANDMALLGQHLKEDAEQPLRMQALSESIKKKAEEIKKKAEERKMKASNPVAPPR